MAAGAAASATGAGGGVSLSWAEYSEGIHTSSGLDLVLGWDSWGNGSLSDGGSWGNGGGWLLGLDLSGSWGSGLGDGSGLWGNSSLSDGGSRGSSLRGSSIDSLGSLLRLSLSGGSSFGGNSWDSLAPYLDRT